MPYTIEVTEHDIVVVVHTGEMTMANATESREEAGRLMHQRGLSHVLVDVDQTSFHPNTLNLMEFNATYYDAFPKGSRIAVVIDPPAEFRADTEFAETVARNRGIRMKLFMQRDPAFAWLKGNT